MEGYKTYIGLAITLLGLFHIGYLVNADQLGNLINAGAQIGGIIFSIYGNYKAHKKIATLEGSN